MSSTNHTTNYNLPQFIGTDKPTWLGDVNQAMSAIDTQMKNNADGITSAGGQISELSTTVGGLTTSVENLGTRVGAVETQANNTDGALNTLSTTVTSIVNSLNLGTATNASVSTVISNLTSSIAGSGTLYLSESSNSTCFKFYGTVTLSRTATSTASFNMTAVQGLTGYYGIPTGLYISTPPTTAYRIVPTGYGFYKDNSGTNPVIRNCFGNAIAVGTDGQIYISTSTTQSFSLEGEKEMRIYFPPCLFFNSDFGDVNE